MVPPLKADSADAHRADPASFETAAPDAEQWDVPDGWHVTWPDPPSARDERIQHMLGLFAAGCAFALASSLVLWLWGTRDSRDLAPNRNLGTFADADPDADPATPAAVLPPGLPGAAGAGSGTTDEGGALAPKRLPGSQPGESSGSVDTRRPQSGRRTSGLLVVSEPPGARVTINGVGYGATPARIAYPPAGVKRIRVTLDGFETEERYFGPESSLTAATLRVVMHERLSKRYRTANVSTVGAGGQRR